MATSFDEVLLNPFYSAFAEGGPEWATAIERSGAGGAVSTRNANREDYVSRYEIQYGEMSDGERAELRNFAVLRRGMAFGFRFLAPDAHRLEREIVGELNAATGEVERMSETSGTNGSRTQFYLIQHYQDIARAYTRRIVKPSPNDIFRVSVWTIGNLLSLAEVDLQPTGEDFDLYGELDYGDGTPPYNVTLNYTTGVLTFAPAPTAGLLIAATGVFHLPACFSSDWHKARIDTAAISDFSIGIEEQLTVELGIG